MGRMSVSIYMKGDYEEMAATCAWKNKPNSKPNYISPRRTPGPQSKKENIIYILLLSDLSALGG
jgi:hypothetical protein